MKTTVYIATTLDGFIAREDGNIDWLLSIENPPNEDYGYAKFIKTIDAFVIGRKTFEKVLTFPSFPYDKPVFVLSTTLKELPSNLKNKVHICSMSPKKLLNKLSEDGYSHLYLDGGRTIQNFLKEDWVDELIITTIPVLIGKGIPLFGELANDLQFIHTETKVYPNGLVKNIYLKKRK